MSAPSLVFFSDEAVEVSGGPGCLGLWDVVFFGVDTPEGRLDVGASEVVLAFFESQFGQDAGGGYLVVSGEVLGSDSEGLRAVFYVRDDVFEEEHDVSSVVGFFEDDFSEV